MTTTTQVGSAAPIRRESWIRQIFVRATMAGLLIAWKEWGIEGAGNLLVFALWCLCVLWVIAMLMPAVKQSKVRSEGQLAFINIYRIAMVGALAWYGHPGLAVLFLIGAFAVEVEMKKYDERGMPVAAGKTK